MIVYNIKYIYAYMYNVMILQSNIILEFVSYLASALLLTYILYKFLIVIKDSKWFNDLIG